MDVIVTGCGRVGSQLAMHLSYEGHNVVVIDKDPDSFRRLGQNFNGIVLEGVAFDEEVLFKAGIEQADAFAAVTNYDNTNLMAAEVAKAAYQVPHVISRLYYPEKELTFFKMGIDYVCGTTLTADRIRERLFKSEHATLQQERLDLGIQVVEFLVPREADGMPLGRLDYGVSSKVVALLRNTHIVKFDGATPLREGDRILVVLRKKGWSVVSDCLGASCPADGPPGSLSPYSASAREEPKGAKVVIGGCSAVGAHLAYLLFMEGSNVTIIDEDPMLFGRLPPNYQGEFLEGVTFEEDVLLKAGIEEADAFVAATKFDNKNLMAAEVARNIFRVPHVMSRLFNPDKEPTFQALQVNYVCGTRLLEQSILEIIIRPVMRMYGSCFNNVLDIVEFVAPPELDGETAGSVAAQFGATIAYVARQGSGYMPESGFIIRTNDAITVLAEGKVKRKLERYIRKTIKG